MKQTDVFDKLDNVLANCMEGKATLFDVALRATVVNEYLKKHPHPHDVVNEND